MHVQIELSLNGALYEQEQTPELEQYEAFQRDVPVARGWTPFRTEWSIYDDASLVGGQVDALYVDDAGCLHMLDWKRSSKDLSPTAKNWGRYGRAGGPLAHVKDTPFHRYSVQLNLYKHILENHYPGLGPIASMHLVQFHPAQETRPGY